MELLVKRLKKGARIPRRATAGSAGYDLYACIDTAAAILPGETQTFPTGIAIDPGEGVCALVFGRSGLGVQHGIVPANAVGVVDSDYRGEILVGLRNQGQEPYEIQPGERIAQLVLVPVRTPEVREVKDLDETDRGTGGFGSTGRR